MQTEAKKLGRVVQQPPIIEGDWLSQIPYTVLVEDNWFTKQLYKFLPHHRLAPLLYELYIATQTFIRSSEISRRYKNAHDLLVNLGSGPQGQPGWVNVDAVPWKGVNCIYDCRKSLPFPSNSVKGILCEHFFEHIDYTEEAPYFLAECYRVLQPEGVIRLIVPDAGKYLQGYSQEGWEELRQIRPLDSENRDVHFGTQYQTKMELINVVFRQGFEHTYAYDYPTLELLFAQAGFSAIQTQDYGKSLMDELCIDLEARAPESLYVEAVKIQD
ncbi:MAG: methyltransferase domain-containing protein [Symploca sp. SIO2D2]|nr:methyltransferase domain-containing protein [Symploca sp. SIO2D2]